LAEDNKGDYLWATEDREDQAVTEDIPGSRNHGAKGGELLRRRRYGAQGVPLRWVLFLYVSFLG